MPILQPPPRRSFSRRSFKNMGPERNLPAPQPTLLHVVSVAGSSNATQWTFDRDVADLVGPLTTLTVNGASPVAFSRIGPRQVQIIYPTLVSGRTWNCPAGAAGIVSVEGYPLAAGSGTVV